MLVNVNSVARKSSRRLLPHRKSDTACEVGLPETGSWGTVGKRGVHFRALDMNKT
jgi:hypothetical protein